MDEATTLVSQRSSLQRLLASAGLPLIDDSDETAYTNLNQVCPFVSLLLLLLLLLISLIYV